MTKRTNRRYDRDFKLAAVGRMEAGEQVAVRKWGQLPY